MISSISAFLLIGLTACYAQQYQPYQGQQKSYQQQSYKYSSQQKSNYAAPPASPPPQAKYAAYSGNAAQQGPPAPVVASARSAPSDREARTLNSHSDIDFDGTFSYGFDTDNGIAEEAKGYIKNPQAPDEEKIQVIQGSYSYIDEEGKPITITYIADEEGYRAFGDAIPTPPEAVAKAIEKAKYEQSRRRK